ncbi:hypothetical protein L6164_003286 [Bauhinia variegata]|uniref:Uncharacterized protein n=1 Tax=Bauhinia variegata TaxID=167791 RepID=A0ACB9Q2V9_BAUVA|nr:hypothetical protein L6164_003286 [Bauhinia variegata]
MQGRRSAPNGVEDAGEAKLRRGNEQETIGTDEGGIRLLLALLIRERGKVEPEVGNRVKGERLVVLGGYVMDSVEKKPWLVMVRMGDGGEKRGGDDGVPELADGGGANESGDGKEGEDKLNEIRAQMGNLRHPGLKQKPEKRLGGERKTRGGCCCCCC